MTRFKALRIAVAGLALTGVGVTYTLTSLARAVRQDVVYVSEHGERGLYVGPFAVESAPGMPLNVWACGAEYGAAWLDFRCPLRMPTVTAAGWL